MQSRSSPLRRGVSGLLLLAIVGVGCIGKHPATNLILRVINRGEESVKVSWKGPTTGDATSDPCAEWDQTFSSGHWLVTVTTRKTSVSRTFNAVEDASRYVGFEIKPDGTVRELSPHEAEVGIPKSCASP